MVKKFFNKNDRWDMAIFYSIYKLEEGKEKRFSFIAQMTREFGTHIYSDYGYITYPYNSVELSKLLEWDIYYGIEKLCTKGLDLYIDPFYTICEPQEAFEVANMYIKGGKKNKGRTELKLSDVTEETPCGDYFYYNY